jgi:2',3'-cyclic-nucleotide 2'-phosphodiesterase / 3'-nucleotidase
VVAIKVTGAQVQEWLEYAARAFNRIDPAATGPQALVNKSTPSYNFDIISGITYQIDVTQGPRYEGKEGVLNDKNRRIVDLRHDGKPVDPGQEFVVITNNHRADGSGSFPMVKQGTVVVRAPDTNRDAILRYFKLAPVTTYPWTFAKIGKPTSVYFDTGKPAASHLADVTGLTSLGDGEPGYLRVGLTLS